MMTNEASPLNIFLFPFMGQGHMIPVADMALLFASKGAKASIITTPVNASSFASTIERSKISGFEVDLKIIEFPCKEGGLPEGCENIDSITSSHKDPSLVYKFFMATRLLKNPIENLIQEFKPDCLVADIVFPWATESAAKFNLPRLVFSGTGFFPLCVYECLLAYKPHEQVSSDSEPFIVPNLPGEIQLTRNELSDDMKKNRETEISKFLEEIIESQNNSYGILVNSFYELETAYADYYRNVLKKKAWHVGPLSLSNGEIGEKVERGKRYSIDMDECLKWLLSKEPNSVVYISFGSVANFPDAQLMEIAKGLEASGQNFIWVVRKDEKRDGEHKEEWLPEGFEERSKEKGLIIRGWAPQVLILGHQATGGFVTHCGWNSTLEGISSGVPMVTWPVSAEQFFNEKLVTRVLKIGVSVGVHKWVREVGDFVTAEKVEKAVTEIMGRSEEAEKRRRKAKVLADMAKRAVEKGGSSDSDLKGLVEELKNSARIHEAG